jgi:hypothetical protein
MVALMAQELPFEVTPEQTNSTLATYTMNLWHYQMGQEKAPFTGYYTTTKGPKRAVTNYFRV